jgi:hypothetical protein
VRLRLRGLSGARDEFLLTAAVQNLKRLAVHATNRRHSPRQGSHAQKPDSTFSIDHQPPQPIAQAAKPHAARPEPDPDLASDPTSSTTSATPSHSRPPREWLLFWRRADLQTPMPAFHPFSGRSQRPSAQGWPRPAGLPSPRLPIRCNEASHPEAAQLRVAGSNRGPATIANTHGVDALVSTSRVPTTSVLMREEIQVERLKLHGKLSSTHFCGAWSGTGEVRYSTRTVSASASSCRICRNSVPRCPALSALTVAVNSMSYSSQFTSLPS